MTQRQTVLAILKAAGNRGVTSGELYAAHLPRFSARILELRADGFVIETERERAGSFRYTLLSAPSDNATGGEGSVPTGRSVFGAEPVPAAQSTTPVAHLHDPQDNTTGGKDRTINSGPALAPTIAPVDTREWWDGHVASGDGEPDHQTSLFGTERAA